jgi:hypothetical protein
VSVSFLCLFQQGSFYVSISLGLILILQKKQAPVREPAFRVSLKRLHLYDIRCLRALGAVDNVKRHILTFGQRLEAAVLNV